jgi:hypothetical protein
MEKQYQSFDDFYIGYFLVGHQHKYTKLFHFIAIGGAILLGLLFFLTLQYRYFFSAVFCGYSISVISHYLFEKNHPATYSYPFYSFLGAFRMFLEILQGKHKIF